MKPEVCIWAVADSTSVDAMLLSGTERLSVLGCGHPSGCGTVDQPTTDRPSPRPIDVEQLLADASARIEAPASAAAATPVATPGTNTGGGEQGIPSWPGVLLMVLGGAALLASNRTVQRAVWPLRIPDSDTELPATVYGSRSEGLFASARIRFAGAGPDEEPQSVAPLVHAIPTRRTVAPEPPSREALWDERIGACRVGQFRFAESFPLKAAMAYRGVEQRGSSSVGRFEPEK